MKLFKRKRAADKDPVVDIGSVLQVKVGNTTRSVVIEEIYVHSNGFVKVAADNSQYGYDNR